MTAKKTRSGKGKEFDMRDKILWTLIGVFFLAGQYFVFQEEYKPGIWLCAAALLFYLEKEVSWFAALDVYGRLRGLWRKRGVLWRGLGKALKVFIQVSWENFKNMRPGRNRTVQQTALAKSTTRKGSPLPRRAASEAKQLAVSGDEVKELSFTIRRGVSIGVMVALFIAGQAILLSVLGLVPLLVRGSLILGLLAAAATGIAIYLFYCLFLGAGGDLTLSLRLQGKKSLFFVIVGLPLAIGGASYFYLNGTYLAWFISSLGFAALIAAFPSRLPMPAEEPWRERTDAKWALYQRVKMIVRLAAAVLALFGFYVFWSRVPVSSWRGLGLHTVFLVFFLLSLPRYWHLIWDDIIDVLCLRSQPRLCEWLKRLVHLGMFCLIFYLAYQGQKLFAIKQFWPGLRYYFYAVSLGIFSWREDDSFYRLRRWPKKAVFIALALIILLGIFLRLYQLGPISWLGADLNTVRPFGLENDEAGGVVFTLKIMRGEQHPFMAFGNYLLMNWFQAPFIKHLGVNHLSTRLPAVIPGVLTLYVFFLMLRLFFHNRIALAGTFLLAVSRWHLHYSRTGFVLAWMPLFQVLGYYFLFRGLITKRKMDFVWAACAISFVMSTHLSALLVPPALIAVYLFKLWQERGYARRTLAGITVFFLAVMIFALPWLTVRLSQPQVALNPRISEVSVYKNVSPGDALRRTMHNLRLSMFMFNYEGDSRPRNNGGLSFEPQLDFWTGILFILGFCYAVIHWKRELHFIFLTWFFFILCNSIFSVESPQALRSAANIPVVLVFACIGLRNIWGQFNRIVGEKREYLFLLILLPFLFKTGMANYDRYFNVRLGGMDEGSTGPGLYAGSLPKDYDIVLITAHTYVGHPPFQMFILDRVAGNCTLLADTVPVCWDTKDRNLCYLTAIKYGEAVDSLKSSYYPYAYEQSGSHPQYGHLYRALRVSKAQIKRIQGLTAYYYRQYGDAQPLAVEQHRTIDFDGVERRLSQPQASYIEWRGSYNFTGLSPRLLGLRAGGRAELWLDNIRLFTTSGGAAEEQVRLAVGMHPLKIRYWPDKRNDPLLFYVQEYGQAAKPVPPFYLCTKERTFGLRGRYYESSDWSGEPVREYIDPCILMHYLTPPLPGAFSVLWEGEIELPRAGLYSFVAPNPSYARVEVGEHVVYEYGQCGDNKSLNFQSPDTHFRKGRYPIKLWWCSAREAAIELYWTPPGGEKRIVPAGQLYPKYN